MFDQVYLTRGTPAAATLTSPAYLAYDQAFSSNRPGLVATYVVLVLLALTYICPFLIAIVGSFKTDAQATNDAMSLIPSPFTVAAYERLFFDTDLPRWALNSVFIAGMAVPSVVLMVPRFLVIKQLGMFDTYFGMILPLLVDAAGIFIMKQFFDSIPASIEEAARIDGAGVFRRFWSVTLPMATPALITLTILSFQGSWNEFAHFIISRQSPELHTLTTGVGALVSGQLGSGNQFPLKLAAAVLMTIPVAILFFIFQKRIMSTTEGAEKG